LPPDLAHQAWLLYTQALDRNSLRADLPPDLLRIDLQLIAMIEDARERLLPMGMHTDVKVFMWGFSATGMFVNRFTLLHPERVKAVASGSPVGRRFPFLIGKARIWYIQWALVISPYSLGRILIWKGSNRFPNIFMSGI